MPIKPQAVIADRLDAALAKQGVSLSRTKVIEVLSAALGFHNSHEFVAAAGRGDLTPHAAEPIGIVQVGDHELVLLRDTEASALYALETSFLDQVVSGERREHFGLTPYGGLIDLAGVTSQPIPKVDAPDDRIAALERKIVDLTNRNESLIALAPDWRAWEKDLKKASHKHQDPISDETLYRFRHAVADNTCKSSESERSSVRYREGRFVEKHLGGLLARLDQAENELAAIKAVQPQGLPYLTRSLYEVEASRDGDQCREVFEATSEEEAHIRGSAIVSKAFHMGMLGCHPDDIASECDRFTVQPAVDPDAVGIMRDALVEISELGMRHPARVKLLAAIDRTRVKATV